MSAMANSIAPATADLGAARRRSVLSGVDPDESEIPVLGDPRPAAQALRELSTPVLDRLTAQMADSSFAVVMADREGRVIHRDAATSTTLTAMDDRSVALGFSLAETDVGTNGVGTSLETRLPVVVVGDDHFLHSFRTFTCANAPVVDPITRRIEGTVGVLCPVGDTVPLLLPTALQLAEQIQRLMLEAATPHERLLLEQFLQRRRSSRRAVASISDDVLIATPSAQRLLTGVDHAGLWALVEAASADSPSRVIEFDLDRPAGPPLHVRCHPVRRAGEITGASVEIVADRTSSTRRTRRCDDEQLGDLVGVSTPWRALVSDAREAARLAEPVLVVGERGSGRWSIAVAIAESTDSGSEVTTFDSASVLVDGARGWTVRVAAALHADHTVVVRSVDQLPDDVAAALAATVAAAPTRARIIATTERSSADGSGLASLFDQLDVLRIEVPALRDRRDDIAPLVSHFAAGWGRHRVGPEVVRVLYRQTWPGNVTELRQAVRSAHAKAGNLPIEVRHLPRYLRDGNPRRPVLGLRQQEAEAIESAIQVAATRTEAAQMLGISRATLYRRIDAYGLDVD